MSAIGKLWKKWVKNGTYTIEQVPPLWREEVRAALAKDEEEAKDDRDIDGTDSDNRETEQAD